MTKLLTLLAISAGLSGCFLSYDPESVAPLATGLALSAPCVGSGQCSSGFCTDGVCCDSACNGQCEACDVAGSEGTCAPATGAPHGSRTACTDGGLGCGGACNGTLTSACTYPTTSCRNQSCTLDTQYGAASCSNGSCPSSSTLPCAPFACGATACKVSCGSSADCSAGNYCNGTSCVPKLPDGDVCTGSAQCQNGHCVDGVCCATACNGQCEACDLPGTEGTCLPVTGAPHGARLACTNGGSGCGGSCDGTITSACDYPTVLCRSQSCTGSTQSYAAFCASGSCPASSTQPCDPYVCGGTGCKTGCSVDPDCTTGNYCAGSSCVPKKAAGVSCGSANQCTSGFCSPDGKCCDSGCTGSCESCNGVNTGAAVGTCAPILSGQRPDPTHTNCTGAASGTCAGTCNGTLTSACAYPTIECRAASCAAGTQTNPASCSGGSCPAVTTAPCAPYVCGPTACKTGCTVPSDCDANNYCNGTTCVPKLPDASPCLGNGECVNGNCADGVCCNTPCGACKSCNQAGKVGLCSNVPLGQDPHDYCSLSSCQAACNGTGGCTTAPAGICNSSGCANGPSDGFGRPISPLATIALCSGATQSCPAPSGGAQSCNLHTCDGPQCNLTCLDNSDCISGTVCLSGKCEYCASSADCYPGAPSCDVGPSGAVCACPGDPGCADAICNSPGDCMAAGFGSVCAQYWDVCQCSTAVGDVCNGRGPRCGGAPGFCTCGAAPDNRCLVGQLCTNNTLGGVCKIAPGFPCTGLPSDCASGACAAGLCTRLPSGRPCAHGSECTSDWCDTTWKCF